MTEPVNKPAAENGQSKTNLLEGIQQLILRLLDPRVPTQGMTLDDMKRDVDKIRYILKHELGEEKR